MSLKKRFYSFFPYLGVFFVTAGILLYIDLQFDGFIGSDAYYHITHAALIRAGGGWGYVASWIPYHFLGSMPVDPYLLHHGLLAAWMGLFSSSILAMKTFAAILSGLVFVSFYGVLKHLSIRFPLIWTSIFFILDPVFLYRLLLDRPFTISIIATILSVLFLIKQRYVALTILSCITILAYNLAVFLIPTAIVYTIIIWWQKKYLDLKPFIAVLGGILIGLVLHPDTVNYIHLIYTHLVTVLSLQFTGVYLPVGGEIMPATIGYTFVLHIWTLLLGIASFAIASVMYIDDKLGKDTIPILFLQAMQAVWLPVVLFVPRGTEYWIPFVYLAIASTTMAVLRVYPSMRALSKHSFVRFFIIPILIVGCINTTVAFTLAQLPKETQRPTLAADMLSLQSFLKTQEATVLFYPSWPMFTELFFYLKEEHQYIAGFDPTHNYVYNHDLYYAWYNISAEGKYCITVACETSLAPLRTAIPRLFNSTIAIVPKEGWFTELETALQAEVAPILFENDSYAVYGLK